MVAIRPTTYEQLKDALDGIDAAAFSDVERNELVFGLRNALFKVEPPWQRLQVLIWENSGYAAALKTAHNLELFKGWVQHGSGTMDLEQLTAVVRIPCDVDLLDRITTALAYRGTLDSRGPKKYGLNNFSRALAEPTIEACLDYWFNIQIPALSALPAFLQSTAYKLPSDPSHTAWNQVISDPMPFYAWLQQRPELLATFAQVMQCYSGSQPSWLSLYPTESILETSSPGLHPLVVDIGGSKGHDVMKFVEKYNPPPGSCYLQDSAEVLAEAEISEAIVPQAYDFFQEQPVKGAKIYYLHNVLHNWPDGKCQQILANIKAAMDSKVSRILIHELVRSEDGSGELVSLAEFTVLAILASPERTEKQWKGMIESAGLRLTHVYSNPLSAQSILEVMI